MIRIYGRKEISDSYKGVGGLVSKLRSAKRSIDSAEVADVVSKIISDVRKSGDSALASYTKEFDGVVIAEGGFEVRQAEIDAAYTQVSRELIETLRRAKQNIYDFHERQVEKSWFNAEKSGIVLGQLCRPVEIVGVYVPGGTAPLPSSVFMNVIPAKVAGVKQVIMCTPPQKNGSVDPVILVAASEAGVDRIFRVGGAQAIAAMAYGTQSIPRVDKIAGPGNIYVASAKKMVYGQCDIDMVAGPSEITIIADDTANPVFVAADLLSQAEHDKLASSVLVTVSEKLAEAVRTELESQISRLSRADIARSSIDNYGAVIIVGTIAEAFEAANEIAPEHLELCIADPIEHLSDVRHAGAVFLGNYSPEPVGDYFAGPNHVLPTGGTARFYSALGADAFMRKISVISYSNEALSKAREDIIRFAEAEGLTAHANSIRKRFEQ